MEPPNGSKPKDNEPAAELIGGKKRKKQEKKKKKKENGDPSPKTRPAAELIEQKQTKRALAHEDAHDLVQKSIFCGLSSVDTHGEGPNGCVFF